MKQRLLLLIAASLACSTAWAYDFSAAAPSGQTLYYNITGSNEVAVTCQNDSYPYYSASPAGDLTIPASVSYSGTVYSVTAIGNNAFYECQGLTSITIPAGVTSIGHFAFSFCSGLTKTNYTGTVAQWCNFQFNFYSNPIYYSHNFFINDVEVKDLIIPDSVTSIGSYAFCGCSDLTSVTIGGGVTSIGESAFSDCSGLTSVTIGSGVISIGGNAFSGCSGLTKTNYTGTVAQWCNFQFYWSTNPIQYSHNFFINDVEVKDLIIPDSVTSIGSYAFIGCSGLTSVTIGSGVTSIGGGAFYLCSGLTSITIPDGVTSIGNSAFHGCSGLTSIIIPDGVTAIGQSTFSYCSGLTTITIGSGVTYMDDYAFNGCSSLTKTNYTGTVAQWCGIKFDYYDSNPVSYSHNLFINDVEIKDLVIPDSVTSIGNYAFYNCSGITEINSMAKVAPTLGENTFNGVPSTIPVNIPCGSQMSYYSRWPYFSNFIEDDGFIFSAQSADTSMGTVEVLTAPTCQAPQAVVNAMAHTGFLFDHWSDGNNDNPRSLTLTSDSSLTAYFATMVYDTVFVHDTTYVDVHDTTYIDVHDTIYIDVHDTTYIDVHDTTYITQVDTVTITKYDTITNTVYDTVDNYIYDTIDNYIYDTVTLTDTLWLTDTVYIHDTVYITQEGIGDVDAMNVKLYQRDGEIVVEGAEGQPVVLYDAVGRMVATRKDNFTEVRLAVPSSGAYLVRVGNHPARRLVVIK